MHLDIWSGKRYNIGKNKMWKRIASTPQTQPYCLQHAGERSLRFQQSRLRLPLTRSNLKPGGLMATTYLFSNPPPP